MKTPWMPMWNPGRFVVVASRHTLRIDTRIRLKIVLSLILFLVFPFNCYLPPFGDNHGFYDVRPV
jgi:hypothetical protein